MSNKSSNFYANNRMLANRDGNHDVANEPRPIHEAPYAGRGKPPRKFSPRQSLDRQSFEELEPKPLWQLISDFITYFATEREQFIYACMIGATRVRYDRDHKYVLNYPGKPVTRQTYLRHKNFLINIFRGLSLKATNQPKVEMVKA
jgi:hypothetical protein